MPIPNILTTKFNFSDHERFTVNVVTSVLIVSMVLTILAAYDYIPRTIGIFTDMTTYVLSGLLLCIMIDTCKKSQERISKGQFHVTYNGPARPNPPPLPGQRTNASAATSAGRRTPPTSRPNGQSPSFHGQGFTLGSGAVTNGAH